MSLDNKVVVSINAFVYNIFIFSSSIVVELEKGESF